MIPGFICTLYEHLADSFVLAKTVDVSVNLEALSLKDGFMGIRLVACHIIRSMVACNHHRRHERNMLDASCLELRNDIVEGRPAFNRVEIYILQTSLIDAVLDYRVVSIGRMRCAVCKEKDCILLALFRELRLNSLNKLSNIITLFFLSHPVPIVIFLKLFL